MSPVARKRPKKLIGNTNNPVEVITNIRSVHVILLEYRQRHNSAQIMSLKDKSLSPVKLGEGPLELLHIPLDNRGSLHCSL